MSKTTTAQETGSISRWKNVWHSKTVHKSCEEIFMEGMGHYRVYPSLYFLQANYDYPGLQSFSEFLDENAI